MARQFRQEEDHAAGDRAARLTTNADTAGRPAVTPVPVAAADSIRITPEVADYGTIRKGTRAVRQFEITNLSGDAADDLCGALRHASVSTTSTTRR